ncbi:MAG: cyclic nucleotide-binding domain-containing protein [Betaproteobacteria bacterium]
MSGAFAYWRAEAPALAVLALVLTVLLLRARPHERPVFLNTLWLFLAGLAGQAAALALWHFGFAGAAQGTHTVFRIVTAVALIRILGFAVFRLALPLVGKQPPRIIEDLAIIVVYVGYGFVQLRGAGVDLASLITTSAILTAVVAFAMQDTLGNVLAGLAIQLDNSVQVGDWVKVENLAGRVRDIRWRSTLLETRDWETVVIPNSMLMKSRVAILGRREGAPTQWRRVLNFMVDPGVPPARVIATLEDEMRELAIPNVARTPAPSVVLKGFNEGNLVYELRYFLTEILEDDSTDSMVRVHLFATLQRAGIRVAEPQRTVHAIARDEAHAATVRRRELTRRVQMLASVSLCAALSDGEKADLAEGLQYAPFARGDVITKQGNAAHWLYIVAFGEAEVLYEPPNAAMPRVVGTIRAGEFFGEMALVSGDARSATVIAKTDVECYRLERASFQSLLATRPELAEEVKRVMATRRTDLDHVRQTYAVAGAGSREVRTPNLLGRLRRFFTP